MKSSVRKETEVSTESGSDRIASKLKGRDGTKHDPVATALGTDFIFDKQIFTVHLSLILQSAVDPILRNR